MPCRTVEGLRSAVAMPKGPFSAPKGKRGTKGLGLRYEKALAKALPKGFTHGQWFQFVDSHGRGWCQPDFFSLSANTTVLLECKLTNVLEAREQITHLYTPVLEKAFGLPVTGIVVVRHLSAEPELFRVVTTLREAFASSFRIPTLHWLGKGPL